MSTPDHENELREGGTEMAVGKSSMNSEDWEVRHGILTWKISDNILGTRIEE